MKMTQQKGPEIAKARARKKRERQRGVPERRAAIRMQRKGVGRRRN